MIFSLGLLATALAAPVFVIEDGDEQMDDLVAALEEKGHTVSRSSDYGFIESEFTGLEVDLDAFDVVFWMDGRFAAAVPMPETGQEALLAYVRAGGGVVLFGQNGFNYAAGRHPILEPLIPLRSWTLLSAGTYWPADETHPLCDGFSVDDELAVTGGRIDVVSPVFGYSVWLSTLGVLERQGAAVYEEGEGRGVQWTMWGNAGIDFWQTQWSDEQIGVLLDNSVRWAEQGPPRPNAGGPYLVESGDTLVLDASGSVARGDAVITSYIWEVAGRLWSTEEPITTYETIGIDGPIELEVILTVVDSEGRDRSASTILRVENAAPVITDTVCPPGGVEGGSLEFRVEASDPEPLDPMFAQWTVDGVVRASGHEVDIGFAQDGVYAVVVSVEDDDGGLASASCASPVVIENVPPSLVGDEPSGSVDAGDVYAYTPAVEDPGVEDVHTWTLDGPIGMMVNPSTGAVTWSPEIEDVGLHPVQLMVDDGVDTVVLEWDLAVQWPDADDDGVRADVDCDDADATVGSVSDDGDCDGMPDEWEDEFGLDPTDAADAASDVDGDGRTALEEYMTGSDPSEYEGPGVPEVFSPEDGGEVNEIPTRLVVIDGEAPLDQPLTHGIILAMDPLLETMVSGAEGLVGSDDGTTSWTIDIELVENTWYYWTAWAEDDRTTGLAMEPVRFFANLINERPDAPGINSPADGAAADSLTLVADVPTDPDRDDVVVVFTLFLSDGSSILSGEIDGVGSTVSWSPSVDVADGEELCWSAIAYDEHGLDGPPSEEACFTLDRVNLAPSGPEFVLPETSVVDTLTPTLVVDNGIDPEGGMTWHRFQVDGVESFTSTDLQEVEVESGADGQTSWTPEALEEDTVVWARALCSDGGQDSEWTTIQFLVSAQNDPPGIPGLLNPADGVAFTEGMSLTITNSEDPEGEAVSFDFQILDLRDHGVDSASGVETEEETTSWTPDPLADGVYQWTARAVDASGMASDWAEPRTLVVGQPDYAEEPELGGMVDDKAAQGCSCGSTGRSGGLMAIMFSVLVLFQRRKTPRCWSF